MSVTRGKRYTSEQKRKAIELTVKLGPTAAGEKLGIAKSTLSTWAKKAKEKEAVVVLEAQSEAAVETAEALAAVHERQTAFAVTSYTMMGVAAAGVTLHFVL